MTENERTSTDDTTEDGRIERLERTVETLAERVVELESERVGGNTSTTSRLSRRSALAAIGLTGLLGFGANSASAGARGQVGTGDDPLDVLFTEELDGGLTGNQPLSDLTGSGLSISHGSLTADVEADTRADVSDDDAIVVADATDIDFRSNLDVSDEGSGMATVNACTGSGSNATVGGGQNNTASGELGTVGGGVDNTAAGEASTIAGGESNSVSEDASTVGGGTNNEASSWFATVAGGGGASGYSVSNGNRATDGFATVGGGGDNEASDTGATVSGGRYNTASGFEATVGGGAENTASESDAVVGGGANNTASGPGAVVPGGSANVAVGNNSFAGGDNGRAQEAGDFVWNDGSTYHDTDGDGTDDGFSSGESVAGESWNGGDTFNVSAQGGVRFVTGPNSVTHISGGSTGWSTTSTRTAKTNVDPVDPGSVLEGVESLQVATWEYREEDGDGAGTKHLGPMAEDFHDAFDVGSSDEHINSINADGVALAAIQGLAERNEETDDRVDELEAENEELRSELQELRAEVEFLQHSVVAADGGEPEERSPSGGEGQ